MVATCFTQEALKECAKNMSASNIQDELGRLFSQANALACIFSDFDFFEWSDGIKSNALWALRDIIESAETLNYELSNRYNMLRRQTNFQEDNKAA